MVNPHSSSTVLRIGIVAGEASGDLLGSHLIQALKKTLGNVEFVGIAGPKMIAAGAKALFPLEKLAVRGYVEVLKHYREIVGIRRKLRKYFQESPPQLFIGVDAPDFNLSLEEDLKKSGIPTVHYVSPSIWAWRGERINKIIKAVSHMLVLFPFEKALYESHGVAASYVGHPLADMIPLAPDQKAARKQLNLSSTELVIAMLPGSRQSEVRHMANLFIKTAFKILETQPNSVFLIPLVSRATRSIFESVLHKAGGDRLPLKILFGHAELAITAADGVVVASGTATLETALLKRPMVITYKMPKLSWKIMQPKIYLPYVGLPNILAGGFIVPEFIQDQATPENIAQALLNLLGDEVVCSRLINKFSEMHSELKQNTAQKAAQAILPFLTSSHG